MSHETDAQVDALAASTAVRLDSPAISRRDVVLVTGPWLAGVSSVAGALRERLPQHKFVESTELGPGDAPMAVVFVVSAAAHLTGSDCALLDAAGEHTDVVVGVVSKIDVHRNWRGVVAADRDILAAHAPHYDRVPWVGAAALPDLGEPLVDDLVQTVCAQLADSAIARRNRLRAWESRLQSIAQRFNHDVEGAGRRARVHALREERGTALRQRRQAKTERTITLRCQIQQARVQLSYFARNRCSSVRGELQEDAAGLSRQHLAGFEEHARGRLDEVVAEVSEGTAAHLTDVAQAMELSVALPAPEELPRVDVSSPPLQARRQETILMALLGAGFGLGVALTLSRLMGGVAARLSSALAVAAAATCVAIGVAVTYMVVNIRRLLHDRALLDRWSGEVTSSLRSVVEELVATQVLAVESLLTTALLAQDETENATVAERVSAIDSELREHAMAATRAAAVRDKEMPTVQTALDTVRAELGELGISPSESLAGQDHPDDTEKSGSRSANADNSGSSESLL